MNDAMNRYPTQKHTKRPDGSIRVQTINDEPSMTQQQFKDECDINNIMRKHDTTGQFTHLTSKRGAYADFAMITDYESMLETVKYADDAFMALPAKMRLRFNNDPGELLQFLQDPNNRAEGEALGLINPLSQPPNASQPINDSNDPSLTANSGKQKTTKTKSEKHQPDEL